MAFFRKKNKKNVNLLTQQHPRPRRTAPTTRLHRMGRFVLLTLLITTGSIGLYFLLMTLRPFDASMPTPLTNSKQLQIVVDSGNAQTLPPSAQEELRQQLLSHLASQGSLSLSELAERLLRNSNYDQLYLYKLAEHQLYVKAWPRQPVLLTHADQLRYVSSAGHVYGQPSEQDSSTPTRLPMLSGLFSEKTRHYDLGPHNSLILTPFEKEILQEAVEVSELLLQENLRPERLDFVLHRGFFCIVQPHGTVVALGRAPFDKKFGKLRKVLAHLTQKGSIAQKIELDYLGKVFIKEKPHLDETGND